MLRLTFNVSISGGDEHYFAVLWEISDDRRSTLSAVLNHDDAHRVLLCN